MKTAILALLLGAGVEFLAKDRAHVGRVLFGISGSDGAHLWNSLLAFDGYAARSPDRPSRQFAPGRKYVLFCWRPRGETQFARNGVEGIGLHTVRPARPARRYRAVTR